MLDYDFDRICRFVDDSNKYSYFLEEFKPASDINYVNSAGNNLLMVYLGYTYSIEVSVVDHIIDHPQFNPNLLNNNGANAFVIAALNMAPFEVFVSLLRRGCDINCVSGSGGTTMSWCLER